MSDVTDAYNAILEDGGPITVSLLADLTVNPLTGVSSSDSTLTVPTYGVQTNLKTSDIDGSLVRIGDQKMIVPALGLESFNVRDNKVRLRVSCNTGTWKVNHIGTLAPYDVDILYYFFLRK